MKSNEASIFVFIASIIVGVLISLNISLSNKSSMAILDTQQYEEAYNTKLKLQNDINNLNTQYTEDYEKLSKYESIGENNTKIVQGMKNELAQNESYIGTEDVHGPGITITLNDGDSTMIAKGDLTYMVHDFDIATVVNELKAAGAEVIAVNGQRIMDRTSIQCDGLLVKVNDVQRYQPFYIDAIGNPNVLMQYMTRTGGYLSYLSLVRNLYVDKETKDDIIIPGYKGSLMSKFAVEVKK